MGPYDILPRAQTGIARLTPSNGSGNRDPTRVPGQARSQGLNGQNRNDAKGKGNGDSSISPIYTSTKRPLLVNEDQETLRKRRKTSPELISTTEVPETEPTPAPPVAASHPPTLQLTPSAQRPSDSSAVERCAPAPRLTPLPPASLYGPPTTRWSPVKPSPNESTSGKTQSFSPLSTLNSRSPTKIPCPPRVWTTTLTHLLSLFPDLGKTQSGLTWGDCATPIMLLGKGKGVNDEDAWVDPVSLNLSMTWKFVYDPRPPLPPPPPPPSIRRSKAIVQPDATGNLSSRSRPRLDDIQRRSRPRDDLNRRVSGIRAERRQSSPSSRRKEARNFPRDSSTHSDSSISPVSDTSAYVPGMYGGVSLFKPLPKLPKIPRHLKVPDRSLYPWRDPSNLTGDVVMDEGGGALPLTSQSTPSFTPAQTGANGTISARAPNRSHSPTHYARLQHTRYTNNTWSCPGSSSRCNNMKDMDICEVTQPTVTRGLATRYPTIVSDNSRSRQESEVRPTSTTSVDAPAPAPVYTPAPTQSFPRDMLDIPNHNKQLRREQDINIDTLIPPEKSSTNVENTADAMNTGDGSAPLTSKSRHDLASIRELAPAFTRPQDIDNLFGARSNYIPVLVWAHQDSPLCPVIPSPEYAYACLGYFFVASIEEDVLEWARDPGTSELRGTVQWRFNLGWAPGGEEFLLDDHASTGTSPSFPPPHELGIVPVPRPDIMRPWWCPSPSPLTSKPITESPMQNLRLRYYSYLPYDSLGSFHPSECSFTRGWFCRRCGLANAPLFFRHWICQSKACMAKEALGALPLGKVVPLPFVREVYAQLPVPLPLNNVPHCLTVKEETWEDEMLSYTYVLRENVEAVYMFVANREALQQQATKFWEDVQRDVVLRRESTANPFFTYVTTISSDDPNTNPREWTMSAGVPECVVHAHSYLLHITEKYGKTNCPRFNRLSVVGWCTSGRKKWPNVLRAKEAPVTILCLGTDVVLHLTPQGGYHNSFADSFVDPGGAPELEEECGVGLTVAREGMARKARENDALTEERVDKDSQERSTSAIGGGTIDAMGGGGDTAKYQGRWAAVGAGDKQAPDTSLMVKMGFVGSHPTASVITKDKGKSKQKKGQKSGPSFPPFSIVLMHGDGIILTGDDYECLVERKGTAMLVIGSAH